MIIIIINIIIIMIYIVSYSQIKYHTPKYTSFGTPVTHRGICLPLMKKWSVPAPASTSSATSVFEGRGMAVQNQWDLPTHIFELESQPQTEHVAYIVTNQNNKINK
jgi:hypothetical protein